MFMVLPRRIMAVPALPCAGNRPVGLPLVP